ncbi:MAG TPA: DnaA/Hda family protein [Gemmatimonadales bacterium]|nr:DnaA/Hda family protein [Gemmatimonadales bacterium]
MTVTLNPLYRFDTLVVGAANRLAVTAAKAVAESPGTVYNPLFVYARPGLGKTHLLMAIGHAARAINPRLAVEYLTLDEFVEAFHAAIAAGHGEAYRKRFLDVDLLLVDDVQFLTHRREMQAELLRLTDALQTASRQIVLTSDRPPADIEALDERLIRRFAGGLIIDVAAPDYETRVAILRRKAEERRASFAEGVLDAVAGLDIDNVRELLGALNRIIAFQAVSEKALTPEQARMLVGGEAAEAAEAPAPAAEPRRAERESSPAPRPAPAVAAAALAPVESELPSVAAAAAAPSEFDDFLSEIAATVAQQVDAWRGRVSAAVLRWQGEGFRTAQIAQLLEQDMVNDPERALREFEEDVERLQALQAEAAALAPELAGSAVFRDPANVAAAEEALRQAREEGPPPPAPSPLWRLDGFVETQANRVVLEAVRAVATSPGDRYNPLVLIGGAAVGKTHLLHAIGNALAEEASPVACLSAPEFTGELIQAIDRDAVSGWRARYRRATAFLLDDVHLIAAKDRTQDELFVLFNALMDQGRQLVFSSAAPLAELAGVEPRLRSRLEGGLVVELPAPDAIVRERVLARDLEAKLGASDAELAAYLASRPADSIRAAQGLLQRVLDAAASKGVPPTAALARELLEEPPAAAPAPRRASGRSSGIVGAGANATRSREKMVWEWPEVAERVIEEWR